ncbi:hypothetical protein Micbo1qcDRAFT_168322 [Microdochium bolleyi]|uniref:Globin family profile domain-containing protein n=1 Tax=Microdochium bolleyi TaxID=196109 RepID=A0A136INS1_9PEZI|nr:hypothetical protein Micbo1qcDRAFT_168322 [Microdochium bolleyi]
MGHGAAMAVLREIEEKGKGKTWQETHLASEMVLYHAFSELSQFEPEAHDEVTRWHVVFAQLVEEQRLAEEQVL